MKIQSLSIVVPTNNKCINNCKFCVSRTHTNPYPDRINKISHEYIDSEHFIRKIISQENIYYKDYFNRLQTARDNGCNVVVLTGTGEPIQNKKFLEFFSEVNSSLQTPFKNIEIQTTGVMLDIFNLNWLRQKIGVTTISFSISNIFDNNRNLKIIGCSDNLKFNVFETINLAKELDFNVRLSLNLVNDYDNYTVEEVINRCVELGADQVTFRKLYNSDEDSDVNTWIEINKSIKFYDELIKYVNENGKILSVLPFGANSYNIKDMSVVVDNDCMSQEIKDTYKYVVLRENGKLYSRWETKSSLIF